MKFLKWLFGDGGSQNMLDDMLDDAFRLRHSAIVFRAKTRRELADEAVERAWELNR